MYKVELSRWEQDGSHYDNTTEGEWYFDDKNTAENFVSVVAERYKLTAVDDTYYERDARDDKSGLMLELTHAIITIWGTCVEAFERLIPAVSYFPEEEPTCNMVADTYIEPVER